MSPARPCRSYAPDGAQQHRDWLNLIEVSGPFLSLPVLRTAWPTLDALDRSTRELLRLEHGTWQDETAGNQHAWIDYLLGELLGWGDALHRDGLDVLTMDVAEHDTQVTPSFVLAEPGADVKPDSSRLLGVVCEPGQHPTSRVPGSAWAATPVDRLAQLCRHHETELGLATDGRWWALVWAPRGGVTTTAVFDAVAWPEAAERDVVRAFVSLLCRRRFFGVPDEESLVPLLRTSLDSQEDITEALGVQVRQAVELLVAAIGRADTARRERGEAGLEHVDAHEIYRGAVSVMMRIVFLLFAEERRLLPSDNPLYAGTYSAGQLFAELERRAGDGSEDDLEHIAAGWHRLRALFTAVHGGIAHPRLTMHAHDGSLFDPQRFPWLELPVDDRTVLHMLKAVQHVWIGKGKSRERRTLSFRSLDVEQIGYVYEGLLSYDGFRADGVVAGLIGKEGTEAEVSLRELENQAARCVDVPALAATLATTYKDSSIGSVAALQKKLAPLGTADREDGRRKLLAVVRGDAALAERLLPFFGVLRRDLRDLPVVILPGALYVTDSPLRKNTGTHYTPRFLAEQVAEGALEPLVYSPGPLQTADKDEWKLRSSEEILSLKVADIAMGSAAFLVAAARYLGAKLLEAWIREGDERARDYAVREPGVDEDPVVVDARREIIEHCLYGVDINPMAVEMAKLSLWLVSMDTTRPFTFLDDRLVAGDSLLGITSLEQLEYLHMDPVRGREVHRDLFGWTSGLRELVAGIAESRREIAAVELGNDPLAALARKQALLADAELRVGRLRLFADLAVGAALAYAGRGERGLTVGSISAARIVNDVASGKGELEAREQRKAWLATDQVDGAFERDPLHWPLVFPEVFEGGGFDAVVGNPPFLGGKKISGSTGSAYREYLVDAISRGVKGNADVIAYFALRAHNLLGPAGQTGLIATNTLAQGDTREVGLDRLVADGIEIRQSIKSKPWPSRSAVLEYCAIWTSRGPVGADAPRVADGLIVTGISATLEPISRTAGNPERLNANVGIVYQGSNVVGIGFALDPQLARALIEEDQRNREVLFPFLNGQDLNTRPDCSASRWIVNFGDMPLEWARTFAEAFQIVKREVKPQRDFLPDYKKRVRENWWKYEHQARPLYHAISGLKRVVVITLVSKAVMPIMVPTGQVFAHKLGVFATDDTAMLGLLSSAPHYWWALTWTSTLETRVNYSPSDVFETLPFPELTFKIRELGDQLDTFRRNVMLSRQSGLTKTYNLVHDSACTDRDIVELRAIHRAIDEATIRAYRWEDRIERVNGLDHGFHTVGRETRYTIGPAAQREILDSLLELNHERYAEEVAQGLHDKKKGARGKAKQDTEGTLFDVE